MGHEGVHNKDLEQGPKTSTLTHSERGDYGTRGWGKATRDWVGGRQSLGHAYKSDWGVCTLSRHVQRCLAVTSKSW